MIYKLIIQIADFQFSQIIAYFEGNTALRSLTKGLRSNELKKLFAAKVSDPRDVSRIPIELFHEIPADGSVLTEH